MEILLTNLKRFSVRGLLFRRTFNSKLLYITKFLMLFISYWIILSTIACVSLFLIISVVDLIIKINSNV